MREVGRDLEAFSLTASRRDDEELAKVYAAGGARIQAFTDRHIEQWRTLARETVWQSFAARNARTAELLRLAEQVS